MLNSKYNPEFNIRRSQLLTPYGTGALIDINNQTIMIADSEYWKTDESNIFHDIRLEQKLCASGFIRPPDINQEVEISGVRFPRWFYAPSDRSLRAYSDWYELFEKSNRSGSNKFENEPYDPRSTYKDKLVPVRLICACSNGHSQDFPWNEWVHQSSSQEFEKHKLELRSSGASSSISDLSIVCKTCNISKRLTNIFDVKSFNETLGKIGVTCNGNHLWKRSDSIQKKCKASLSVLLKNSNSFYFPNIVSSVNIPFKENKIYEKVIQSEYYSTLLADIEEESKVIKDYNSFKENQFLKRNFKRIFEQTKEFTPEEIMKSVYEKELADSSEYGNMSDTDFKREEYEVLSGQEDYDRDNNRLNISIILEEEFKNEKYGHLIKNITLVNKVEVVRVLESYSRIRPTESIIEDEEESSITASTAVSLKRKDKKYIGVDLLGEGIFISFDKHAINRWKNSIENQTFSEKIYEKINNSSNTSSSEYICPEFYMLHTLSHILIKELSETSGYSSSALAERLYFSNEENKEMYGILIYTSSSDSEGTLGGLVKQGYPQNLMRLLDSAVEKSKWCSFDPICITSKSQGRDSLNGSACHACSLISETSCELSNLYLDRSMLIGDLDNPQYGFFNIDKSR